MGPIKQKRSRPQIIRPSEIVLSGNAFSPHLKYKCILNETLKIPTHNIWLLLSVTSVVEFSDRGSTRKYIFAQKTILEKYFIDLTFTDSQTGHQKVPKSDTQSQFSTTNIIRMFLFFVFLFSFNSIGSGFFFVIVVISIF